MRVLNLATTDTGGNGIRTKQAFDRYTDWSYDLVTSTRKYMDYPADKPWNRAQDLAAQADVLHLRNSFALGERFNLHDKPMVFHHHGTQFRYHFEDVLKDQRQHKAIGAAATLDLWLIAPDETEWLPSPYNLDWLASLANPHPGVPGVDRPLRIAHAPTDRRIKGTDAFLAAVERIRQTLPVELILIERDTWANCLKRKATADIYYDQVELGYGNNAIEAWGMGIPVIAGAQDNTLEEMTHRFDTLPFYQADEGTLHQALLALADPTLRDVYSTRGIHHVRTWHNDKTVVTQMQDMYTRAITKKNQ